MTEAVKQAASSAADAVKNIISSPAPPTDQYLRWDAPGVEEIKPNEQETSAKIGQVMNRMQERNFAKHRHAFRATHVKVQGVVKGKLEVRRDIPQHLRQGMFSEPGKVYDVVARYANEPYLLQPDQAPGPRGLSMKVFGVSGHHLPGAEESTAQDWFFNNAPMLELTDIDTTLQIMTLREQHFDDPTTLGLKLRTTRTDPLKQTAPYSLPNTNMISHSFYTQSAFRFGEYYGHLGLFPVLEEQSKQSQTVTKNDPETVISDWLQDYFRGSDAKYEFRIQLGTDPKHHPTEDASVVWDEKTAPYQTIATVTFPRQDSFDHKRRAFWDDHMQLSPWAGLEAHRPLGSVNRLRRYVYESSKNKRCEINAASVDHVSSIEQVP